jgi:hypothetical protein
MPSTRSLRRLTLFVALMGVGSAAWAQAQPPQPAPARPQQHGPRDQRALSDAVRRAERNGQVLSAEQVQYDGRDVNRVKIVDDRGRVRVYWDDPAAQRQPQPSQDRGQGQGRRGTKPPADGRTRDDDDGDPTL